ncbi:MAG: DUF4411 family protein [Planctomycetes bacterium]|nr:DUF4411 family protein [Planctomycetota bacterium]
MSSGRYCIDTSSLIHGWVRAYPLEVFPTFWGQLQELVADKTVFAPQVVEWELETMDDDLLKWCKEAGLFLGLDDDLQGAVSEVLLRHEKIIRAGRGVSDADVWVVAAAKVIGATVVSEENLTGKKSKPRIPDVCLSEGVDHVNLLSFLRTTGWTF